MYVTELEYPAEVEVPTARVAGGRLVGVPLPLPGPVPQFPTERQEWEQPELVLASAEAHGSQRIREVDSSG